MQTQNQHYLSNLGSNSLLFSKATVKSISSLVQSNEANKILRPLIRITLYDTIPIVMAYFVQQKIDSYKEQDDKEADYTLSYFVLTALYIAVSIALHGFEINRAIRGNVRSSALLMAIPTLLNKEAREAFPPADIHNGETLEYNVQRINNFLNDFLYSLLALIPRNSIFNIILLYGVGFRLVNKALDNKTLKVLKDLKINSLHLIMGAAFVLGNDLKNRVIPVTGIPYIDSLSGGLLYLFLFSVAANLKLKNLPLKSELYDVDLSISYNLLSVLHPVLENSYRIIEQGLEIQAGDASWLNPYTRYYLHIMKKTGLWPSLLQSPTQFFDDPVINGLLTSLPSDSQNYLLRKYSTAQNKTLAQQLELLITRSDVRGHPRSQSMLVRQIGNLLPIERFFEAFKSKMHAVQVSQTRKLMRVGLFKLTRSSSQVSQKEKNLILAQFGVDLIHNRFPLGGLNRLDVFGSMTREQYLHQLSLIQAHRNFLNEELQGAYCGLMNSIAIAVLERIAGNSSLERVYLNYHTMIVIGRNPSSDPNNIHSWGDDAVICDPWAGKFYAASLFELERKEGQKIGIITLDTETGGIAHCQDDYLEGTPRINL